MTMRSSILTVCVVVTLGCAYTRPWVSPKEWDKHANAGVLKVYGEDPVTAGPRVYRTLLEQPDLAEFLGKQGEPDELEISGNRYGAKSIVLTYTRENPRTIRLEQMRDGTFVAHAPEKLVPKVQPTPSKTGKKPKPGAKTPHAGPTQPGETEGAAAGAPAAKSPTAEQKVGCPIDPTRPDCQALCGPGVKLEWCR